MSPNWRLKHFLLVGATLLTRAALAQEAVPKADNIENSVVDTKVVHEQVPTSENSNTLKPITSTATIRDTGITENRVATNVAPEVAPDVRPVNAVAPVPDPSENAAKAETPNTTSSGSPKTQDNAKGQPPKDLGFLGNILKRVREVIQTDFNFLISCGTVMSSLITQLIPLHTIMTVRWNKSTGNLKTLNFVTVAFANFLWSLYGMLFSNTVIILSSLPGFAMNCCYILVFHRYCHDPQQMHILNVFYKVSALSCVILAIVYASIETTTYLNFIGLFGGSIQAFSYIAPLFSIREIMKQRSTSAMPTEISLANFIGSFFTLCYGFIIWDYIVIAPNFIGMVSGLIQIVLLILIPNNEKIVVAEVGILENQHLKPILKPYMDI
ncbi:saliva family protein protein [Babesia ovis]|uniref:Saliva family protein protein n=1 Tax=Babesia ovis TaxID=5869 RepID=A0A9W5TA48_BABOV|nr:saliva family protein protein [Babesia ovis]